jgi:hypothetical protein
VKIGILIVGILAAFLAGAQTTTPKYVPAAPEQPLPFNHKKHLTTGLECKDCHTMPSPGDKATFPSTAKCMSCHATIKTDSPAIQRLAEYNKNNEIIPWKRVYHLPDYVFFSHKVHVTKAKAACEDCHGKMQEMEITRRVKPTNMAACMECHRSQRASLACDSCHAPQ